MTTWTVGDVRITKVPQMSWNLPLWGLVPEATAAACAEVAPGWVGEAPPGVEHEDPRARAALREGEVAGAGVLRVHRSRR